MPRGGGFRGGGGGFGGGGLGRRGSASPKTPWQPQQKTVPQRPGIYGGQQDRTRGPGMGGMIAGTFLGSALGTVLGNAISQRMYQGRNPETGAWEDPNLRDDNPCKKELDYLLDCSKYSGNQSYCKSAGENLKKCADKNKDYFEDD